MSVLIVNGRKDLASALRHILDNFKDRIDFSRGIFLKPNIVFPVKETSGEITRLTFVKILVALLRERRSDVDIVIGEGVAAGCDPQENFTVSGYTQLAHEFNVPLLDLHAAQRTTVSWKYGKLELPRIALERAYINLPILKASTACVISGALKNQKGLVLPAVKKQFHRLGLHEQLAELNAAVRPSLTIMDCSSFFGHNVVLSGDNCGEIDETACKLLKIGEPEHVYLSRIAKVFADGFSISGDLLAEKRIVSRPRVKEFKRMGRLRLWSNPQACSMCRYLLCAIQRHPFKRGSLAAGVKLFRYAFKGAEVIMGMNPLWRREYTNVICIGECTRDIARKNEYLHVPGCPPTSKDIVKCI